MEAKGSRISRSRQASAFALVLPALTVLLLVMLLPLGVIVARSFTEPHLGIDNYVWFFTTNVTLLVAVRTFKVALWVTFWCVIVAYPYAFAMSVVGSRLRILLTLCVLVPFWVSGVVRTFAWVVLLQDSGVINQTLLALGFEKIRLIRTQTGVTIGMAQILLPFMIMPLYSVMRGIDRRLLKAARSLGATPVKAFWQIYLPLSLPGVFSGAVIVFILALGFYITPLLLGGASSALLSTLIQQQIQTLLNWGRGGAMGMILLLMTLCCLALALPFMRYNHSANGEQR